MAEATTNPGGSTHSVPGASPQDSLANRNSAATATENGNPANKTPATTLSMSPLNGSQNVSLTSGATPSSLAGTGFQNGGSSAPSSLPSSLPGSQLRSNPLSSTSMTTFLSSLSSLSAPDRALVDTLAKSLAAQMVSQGNTAVGGANGNASSTSPTAVPSLANKPIFTTAAETHAASYEQEVGIHPEISTLAETGIRPPLTLFSNHALQELNANPASHRTKYKTAKGNSTLINVGAFGREEDLGPEDWKECWKNMLKWQKKVSEVEIYERWRKHFEVLSNLSYFQAEFAAIRTFDISERSAYFTTRFSYVAKVWWARLSSARQQASREEFQEIKAEMYRFAGPVRTDHAPPARHQPYAPTRRLCLRCGRPDEVASACTHSTTVHGYPIITHYDSALRTLTSIDGDFDYCFEFNFGGPARCRGNHSASIRDACSVCGGEDHHAASGNCPV